MGDAERDHLIRLRLSANHPNLMKEHFKPTSPEDKGYNCMSWAGNDTTKQWDPSAYVGLYWPSGPQPYTIDGWMSGYEALGYQRCDSGDQEPETEKIAIYVAHGFPTHVARQKPNGKWTSKMGKKWDIEHTLEGLNGGKYGQVEVFMKRCAPQLTLPLEPSSTLSRKKV